MKKTLFYKEYREFNNIREIFADCVANHPNDIAYSYKEDKEWKQKTFKETWDDVNRLSNALIREGLGGKTISIVGPTTYTWLVSFFAILNVGSVAVSPDKGLGDEELAEKIMFTDSDAFIYDKEYETVADHCADGIRAVSMEDIKKEMTSSENSAEIPEVEINPDDTALIIFTSGTTSVGKAVMLSQRNILAPAPVSSTEADFIGGTFLMLMPLSHSFGITQVFWSLYSGANFVINDSVKNMLANMAKFKPTEVTVIPMIVEMVYNNINKSLVEKGKLKTVTTMRKVCRILRKCGIDIRRKVFKDIIAVFGGELCGMPVGGAYLNPDRIKFFDDIGINLVQGYGLTETAAIVSANGRGLGYKKFDSVGCVMPYNEVRIAPNGEIQIKGTNVTKGYYKNEEATKAAFDGEWFKTGDLGYLDDEGYLYITGRIKNLIILSNGENVSPEVLEGKIEKIECVKEVIVKESEGKICAEVFMGETGMSKEDAEKHLRDEITALNRTLPTHHNIAKIEIRDTEFPKNATNKIIRKYN